MMRLISWTGLLGIVLLVGCGGGAGSKSGPTEPSDADFANNVADMLKEFSAAYKRGPAGVQELNDASATHPVGHTAVVSNRYIVFWKAPINPSASNTVLAYHKDVPTKGGTVIMQDGSIKTMTADEFKNAPKAGK